MPKLFGNKVYIEPSTGARVITNVAPTPNLLSSGVVAVIGESTGGLTFQDGTLYETNEPNFLKDKLIGGVSARCIDFIFNPSPQTPGANKVIFIRAQQATVAVGDIVQSVATTATLRLTTIDKGLYLSDATNGIKWKLIAGTVDTAKHILMLQQNSEVVWTSPEISTFQELIDAITNDTFASSLITAAMQSGVGTTAIENDTRTVSYAVFTGGTSPSMTGTDIDSALQLLKTKTVNFVFIASEVASNHLKGVSYCNTTAENPCMCISGGSISETVAEAIARSAVINDENGVICWPGIKVINEAGTAVETLSPMYHAAMVTGLAAGLNPEVPLTWKRLNVLGFETPAAGEPSVTDRESLINGGTLFSRSVPGIGFAVNKGVNTLQSNGSMIYQKTNGEATSPEISIIRIMQQLIQELEVNSAPLFVGGTAAIVSKEDVINFTISYLNARTSTPTQSNLLINFSNVNAELQDDAWYVTFGFTPNTPINHTFFTGAMLKP